MNQVKIGNFLKELRTQKGMTQEQLAEHLSVTSRTVSRWENGSNLPDLDLLLILADDYGLELREILNGERSKGDMKEEVKETVRQVAELTEQQKEKINRRMNILFWAGTCSALIYMVLSFLELDDTFFSGLCLGVTFGMTMVGVIMTSKNKKRLRKFQMRILGKKE